MTIPWPAEGPTLLLCKLLVRDWLGVGGCIPSQFPNIAEAVRLFGSLLEHSLWNCLNLFPYRVVLHAHSYVMTETKVCDVMFTARVIVDT